MSSEGSVSTNASSRIRQFGLYRTIDARTEEFLRLSRKRQIKQGCACAAISTAITVTVVITVFLVYMEYGINTALNQQPLGKASWIGLLNDTLASTFEDKFSKSKLNFDRATIKLLPLLIKALKQNRYLEKIIEDYSSSSSPYEGKVTTEYTLNKGLFSSTKNWFKKPTSRLFTIEYKTSPIVYYKTPSKNLAYFTKIRKIRDYKRIMKYVNKMISDKVIDHTLPMLSDEYKTETMKPPKKVHKTSKKTVTAHLSALQEKTQKMLNPSQLKMKSNKQIKIVSCKCPKQLSVLLNKIVSSIHQLLPDKKNNKTASCLNQQRKRVTTTASTSTIMTTTTTTPTSMTPITMTPTTMTQSTTTSTTKASTTMTPTTKTPTTKTPTSKTRKTNTPTTKTPTTKTRTTKTPTTKTPTIKTHTIKTTTTKNPTTKTPTTTTRTTTSRTTTNLPTTTSNKIKLSTRGKNAYPLLFSEFDNIFPKEDKDYFESNIIRGYEETTKTSKKPESLGFKNTQQHIKEVISQDNLKVTTVKQFIEPTEVNRKFSSTQSITTLKEHNNYKEDLVTIFTPTKYVPLYNVKQSPHYNEVDLAPKLKTPKNPVNNDHNILGFVDKLTYHIKSNNSDVVTSTVSSVSGTIADDAKRFDINSFDLFKSDAFVTSKRPNLTQQLPSTEHLPLANTHSTTSKVFDAITPTESYITSKRIFTPLNTFYKGDYYFHNQNTAKPKMYDDSTTPLSRNRSLKITIDDAKKIKSNDERKLNRYQNYFHILSTSRLEEDEVEKTTREEEYHEEYNVNPTESLGTVTGTKLTSKIVKDLWELLKSYDSSTILNSMIPVNRPTYLEIHRNGWRVDENDDYDLK